MRSFSPTLTCMRDPPVAVGLLRSGDSHLVILAKNEAIHKRLQSLNQSVSQSVSYAAPYQWGMRPPHMYKQTSLAMLPEAGGRFVSVTV